jgi:hypothetical protein
MSAHAVRDWRHIVNGWEIPSEHYSDQPYVVKTDDGAWLCVLTTGRGMEGQRGQHVITTRSTDQGRTWSDPVDVEPADGPEASYAVLLKAPGGTPTAGRITCFYNHNTDNVRQAIADDPPYEGGVFKRVDSLGHFVFKVSDDHGRTWSAQRYDIPMRTMTIDRENPYGGELKYFWNVGKPFIHGTSAYVPLHKIGRYGIGSFARSEGVFLKSDDLLLEPDPAAVTWETLPEGEIGLRTPPGGGAVAEEQSTVVLSDGTLTCVYRTIDGFPAVSTSRDGGRTWAVPEYLRDGNGRWMKHPRAACFVWRCENGKYLLWTHNHGGRFIPEHPDVGSYAFQHRNPVWLCGGVEVETPEGRRIQWSQPEILLYDDDPFIRMSYPDLIEEDGRTFVTETQKDVARVHEIPAHFLETLWGQFEPGASVARRGVLLAIGETSVPSDVGSPALPALLARDTDRFDHGTRDLRAGFSLALWLKLETLRPGQVVLSNRTSDGRGFALQTASDGTLALILGDRSSESRWRSDPGLLRPGVRHHVVVIVDGGPKVITFVIDGVLCDGGDARQFGWGRYNPNLRSVRGAPTLALGPSMAGALYSLRIYDRPLLAAEAVGNYRAGRR